MWRGNQPNQTRCHAKWRANGGHGHAHVAAHTSSWRDPALPHNTHHAYAVIACICDVHVASRTDSASARERQRGKRRRAAITATSSAFQRPSERVNCAIRCHNAYAVVARVGDINRAGAACADSIRPAQRGRSGCRPVARITACPSSGERVNGAALNYNANNLGTDG